MISFYDTTPVATGKFAYRFFTLTYGSVEYGPVILYDIGPRFHKRKELC